MNITRRVATLGIAALSLLAATGAAQTAPASSSTSTANGEEVITLTPFEVNSDADVGYVAQNTLAGSRLNTSLKDTAASLSVLTAEFLSDIGANSLEEAMMWTTNSQLDMQDAGTLASSTADDNSTFGNFASFRVRGLPSTKTRNYFAWHLPIDSYNIERVEEARGPNSILFGIGAAGGVLNTSTKRALLGRDRRSASIQVSSNDGYRGAIDVNQRVGEKLAVRFNGVYNHAESHRLFAFNENRQAHVSALYQVLPKTRIRVEYETGIVEQGTASNDPITDQYTTWINAGSRIIEAPIPTGDHGAYGVGRLGNGTQVYYIGNNNSVINMAGQYRSGGTDNVLDRSVADYSVNTGGPGSVRRADFNTASVFLEQQIGENTFVELAYNHQDSFLRAYQPASNSRRLYGDPNAFLRNGEPNPYAGQLMLEGATWTWDTARESDNFRASIASDLDFGKWGNYRLAGMTEYERRPYEFTSYVEAWEGSPFHSLPENAANVVTRRNYITPGDWSTYYRTMPKAGGLIQGLTDPVSGRTLSSTFVPRAAGQTRDNPEEQETMLVALQARYLKERLVFGLGHRWDTLDVRTYGTMRDPVTQFWSIDPSTYTDATYKGRTRTIGVVGHLTKNLSVFYNNSDNFNLPGSHRILPDSQRVGNSESTGEDIGLALDLFGGKVFARASYYKVDLANGSSSQYGGTSTNPTSISNIILDALLNEPNPPITPAEADARRTDTSGSTFSRLVEGYELNITANPTRNWRLQANFSFTDGYVSNVAPEVKDWVAENIPYYQGFDQNIATGSNARTIGQVLAAFMEYHNEQLEGEGLVLPGNRKYKMNLFTSYNFSEGALKGFSIGGGYLWQSKLPVGILGPGELRYSNALWNTNAMIGYRFNNVPWLKRLHVQLNVYNVTDDEDPVILRYQGNNPDFPSYDVIRRIRPKAPRTWRLTANFDF